MNEPGAGITDANLLERLLEAVPELKAEYEAESRGERLGNHIVMGVVLYDHVLRRLRADRDDGGLRRIFDFIEQAAGGGDEKVANAVAVSFVYSLWSEGDAASLERARRLMGKTTLSELQAIEDS